MNHILIPRNVAVNAEENATFDPISYSLADSGDLRRTLAFTADITSAAVSLAEDAIKGTRVIGALSDPDLSFRLRYDGIVTSVTPNASTGTFTATLSVTRASLD
jgi:hypothetical protein